MMHADQPPDRGGIAPLPSQQPGTLLWIGSRSHGEMVQAYRDCEAMAPQLAVRATMAEAIRRPAALVRQIIVARPDRAAADVQALTALRALYPEARRTCLLGSGCEGERRTGDPWPDFRRIYWHQWNQHLPRWLCDDHASSDDATVGSVSVDDVATRRGDGPPLVVVLTDRFDAAAPILDLLQHASVAGVWLRPGQQFTARGVGVAVWDDSVAPPAPTRVWRQRLAAVHDQADRVRHVWLVGFPRLHHWKAARRGGIDTAISKPYDTRALQRAVLAPQKTTPGVVC